MVFNQLNQNILKKLIVYLVLIYGSLGFAQSRKGQFYLSSNDSPHVLYVSFGLNVNFSTTDWTSELKNRSAAFKLIADKYSLSLRKELPFSDEKLTELELSAQKVSGSADAVKRLRGIFKVEVQDASNAKLVAIASELELLPIVDYCSLSALNPIRPPSDIPPTTPNFEINQTYIQSNPGVNMQYAWNLGLNGQGIRLRDVEYGFNKNHEELSDIPTSIATGMTVSSSASLDYTEHGTGVFGIIYAHKGTYGISGLAYGASEMVLFPEWQQTGYDRVNAITQAISNSSNGDVILYEMQSDGPGPSATDYILAEFDQVVWDLTKAATDSGITIVAAAGNGNVDLDGPLYSAYMARGDSGAIVVGAGSADNNHNRLGYSTYGSRVDLQAWGENVLSIGKLTGFNYNLIGNDINQSYITFTGTSAAVPIVASCAAVLQSYYFSLTGNYLTPIQLRGVLESTGIPQGTAVSGNIGPIPNMQPALQAVLDLTLSQATFSDAEFYVYPNPVSDQLFFVTPSFFEPNPRVEVVNGLGQTVLNCTLSAAKTIDVSHLPAGFYFVTLTTKNQSVTKKISKN